MKLQSLTITENQSWEENPGQYKASIKYVGAKGSVELQLDEAVSAALLATVGDVVTKFAAKASEQLQATIEQSLAEARAKQLPEVAA